MERPQHSSKQFRNFKLLVDPQLKKGQEKLIRFDGDFYSCVNHGQRPVVVRDPRAHTSRLWARRERVDLPAPRYKVDEWYIGAVPPREVTFSKLNDNITKQFMEQLCGKYGKLERVRVYHHPKTGKHMGLAKVVFVSIKSASTCIQRLHQTSIMGNVINAELDCKGELLKKLHHKIIKGELGADTMPDVIKHTQEKPKTHPHKRDLQRRKSSTDDPRRKSLDALERRRSVEQSSLPGPKTPPIKVPMEETMEKKESRVPPVPHPGEQHPALNSSSHSPRRVLIPAVTDLPKPHSLESGYGSHPGSASLISDQTSPFCLMSSNTDQTPDAQNHEESLQGERRDKSKLHAEPKNKLYNKLVTEKFENNETKFKVWTKDLQNRIESLLHEQNEKYNLGDSKNKAPTAKTEKPRDEAFQDEQADHAPEDEEHFSNAEEEATPADLEDGECSGDDGAEEVASSLMHSTHKKNDRRDGEPRIAVQSDPKPVSSPHGKVQEAPRQRFSRSPSPFHYPTEHSPRMVDRVGFDGRHERFSPPPPGDHFHRRIHHSPGRPPMEFNDRGYHAYGARPQSPPFVLPRRHSPPYDAHHRPPRSPGYDYHHHHHHHHRFSPPRRRPPSPGYVRHRDMRPGHPDFVRRRSPSPGYPHHRRSPSPMRKFAGGTLLRREYDYSPHRERMYYSPHDMERHRGGFSPRHPDHERHRRNTPPHRSPDASQLREHRELPPEFRERRAHRSPSPHTRMAPTRSKHPQRSRSSSPETLQSTPPRIRSPVRIRPDQKPYSPGDLPLDESNPSETRDALSVPFSGSDTEEPGSVHSAKRKDRESSDHDTPLISLDERLREITGEPPPEESPVESPPKPAEEVPEASNHVSPPASEDMEISSGGGNSEHGDHPPPHFKQPHPEMGFRPRGFRPPFPPPFPPNDPSWRCNGPGPPMMWNDYNARFPMNRPMWHGPPDGHMRFPPNIHNGFPQPMMNHPPMDQGFNNQMLPPPPPGWNRPWVQGPPHQMEQQMNAGTPFNPNVPPSEVNGRDPKAILSNCVLGRITDELKEIIKRDLNKKVIETMAFKVYEAWWDQEHALKNPKPIGAPKPAPVAAAAPSIVVKTEPVSDPAKEVKVELDTKSTSHSKMPALLNTFDPLNWAKGSLEMDGFRIGLGFRSAISKMPSFRVKKRTPSPTSVPEKKLKLDSIYRGSKAEKEKQDSTRKRIWLDSEGEEEEEDESDQESSEEEEDEEQKDGKSRVLHVEDVFSSSSSSEEEETSDEEDDEDSEEESEEEQDTEKALCDHKIDSKIKRERIPDDLEPPKKKNRLDATASELEKPENLDDSVSLAAASLSELQSGRRLSAIVSPPPGSATEKDFRHVHPKKRYRVLSKDETHNLDLIAEVSNRLRSDDEMSSMSDKEKAALEVLQEMKSTPERPLSSANRLSESSDSTDPTLQPPTPARQHSEGIFSSPAPPFTSRRSASADSTGAKPLLPPVFNDSKRSGEEELEAVEALLSIKQSQPPIPPLSPTPSSAILDELPSNKMKEEDRYDGMDENRNSELSKVVREKMAALAEEHNYFAAAELREPRIDPSVQKIIEEHNYSLLPSQAPKTQDRHQNRPEVLSAAERVKLRRVSKTKEDKAPATVHVDVPLFERKRKPTKYRPRSKMEEMALLYLMWNSGLDLEDMKYLRYEYEQLLTQVDVPQWANDTHWTAHPVTCIPNPDASPSSKRSRKKRKKAEQNEAKVHETGCARSEGYYKVADKTKLIQRRLMYRHADNSEPVRRTGRTVATSSGSNAATENSREARHMMRRIASEFGSDASDLLKYNQLMFRKKAVKFKRSRIHGWGLFAQETIGADEMVIEYVGQLVRSLVADRREVDYTKRGIGSSYLFRIDSDHIIDATKCGNYARFMNHSCDPSCYAKVITVEGAKKIVIYSKNVIKPSEEITYDYKFPIEDVKIPCFCGAINCRGTLN